ncbi:MAG TPA: hypothetical protein VIN06_05270 [Devosia sp.]
MTMQVTDTPKFSVPNWLRSVGAVVAGFATVVVLSTATDAVLHSSGIYPPLDQPQGTWTLAVALAYRTLFTVAGGYLTAMLAPRKGMKHAVVLGAIGTLAAMAGMIAMWSYGEHWYPIALTVLALPSTWLGGYLRTRR